VLDFEAVGAEDGEGFAAVFYSLDLYRGEVEEFEAVEIAVAMADDGRCSRAADRFDFDCVAALQVFSGGNGHTALADFDAHARNLGPGGGADRYWNAEAIARVSSAVEGIFVLGVVRERSFQVLNLLCRSKVFQNGASEPNCSEFSRRRL
jgi:hypothetical protein